MARLMLLLMVVMASFGGLMIFSDVSGVRALLGGIFTGPGSISRIITLLVILTNLKVFPFVWHIRIFNALFQHFFLYSRDASSGPAALFQPIVTSSRAPILECDYNFHKSNSTFFADLDVTRIHLLARLFRQGITTLRKTPSIVAGPDGVPAKGKLMIILGGTHCSFRREIKPFQAYEMWSRVLAWDQKWIYIVTHFVTPHSSRDQNPQARVLASAISKYVLKLDRLTIHPEVLLSASHLLPAKPGGWHTMSSPTTPSPTVPQELPQETKTEWDHARVEAEKARGLRYANSFGQLDDLQTEFCGADGGVLGVYRDL